MRPPYRRVSRSDLRTKDNSLSRSVVLIFLHFAPGENGGIVEYYMDGEVRHEQISKLNDRVVAYADAAQVVEEETPPAEDVQAGEEAPPQEEASVPAEDETTPLEEEELAPAAEEDAEEDNAMPMRDNGEEDWQATTPEHAHSYIFNEAGLSQREGNEFVAAQKDAAQRAPNKAKSAQAPRVGTSIRQYNEAKVKHQEKIENAQRVLDYWNAVQDIQVAIQHKEREQKEAEDAKAHEEAAAQMQAEFEARKAARAEAMERRKAESLQEDGDSGTSIVGIQDEDEAEQKLALKEGENPQRNVASSKEESPTDFTPSPRTDGEDVIEDIQAGDGYSIEPTNYTNKKGKTTPMHLVRFERELSKEEIRAGKEIAKESRGWWDSKQGGFMMRSEEAAKALAESLSNEEAVQDAQPLSVEDMAAVTGKAEKVNEESANVEEKTDEQIEARGKAVEEASKSEDVRFRQGEGAARELEEVNEWFNRELAELTEKNAQSKRLQLGQPSLMLSAAGVPDKPIILYGNKLLKKAKLHNFDVKELHNLPLAMRSPIAVFEGSHPNSFATLLEIKLGGHNTLVSIEVNKKGEADFNIISSLFGKASKGVTKWILDGKLLSVDKEKAQSYISASALNADATYKNELSSAANILKDFENPTIGGKNHTTLIKSAVNNNDEFSPESDNIRYREGSAYSENTLVGVHNISADKLSKAIKQGGLANPSVAIIDINKQQHTGYGEISLIMPSAKINKRTEKNAGTFEGDAWTPMYPSVEKRMTPEGGIRMEEDIDDVPKAMQPSIRAALNAWCQTFSNTALHYLYLHQIGKAPEVQFPKSKYSDEVINAVNTLMNGASNIYTLPKEVVEKLTSVYIDSELNGDKDAFQKKVDGLIAKNKYRLAHKQEGSILYKKAQLAMDDVADYGYPLSIVRRFVEDVQHETQLTTRPDVLGTLDTASEIVEQEGLSKDFDDWLSGLDNRYEAKEVIFDGFTPSGKRRYIPNYYCPVNFKTAQESFPKPFRIGLRAFFFKKQAL